MTFHVFQCRQCATTLFPARYFCPVCGGAQWEERVVERGFVAESTVVRRRVGAEVGHDVHLASVVTSAGPVVIARIDQAMLSGTAVCLDIDDAGGVHAHCV
jgi:hypothetical protein